MGMLPGKRVFHLFCVFYFSPAPVEEGDVEDGETTARKQCIVSLSPKTWKVSRFSSEHWWFILVSKHCKQILNLWFGSWCFSLIPPGAYRRLRHHRHNDPSSRQHTERLMDPATACGLFLYMLLFFKKKKNYTLFYFFKPFLKSLVNKKKKMKDLRSFFLNVFIARANAVFVVP